MNTYSELEHNKLLESFRAQPYPEEKYKLFNQIISYYYTYNRRSFVWREEISPYSVVLSEIMLQQTQTERVAQKFPVFLNAFPDFKTLAAAPFGEVLKYYKGLGYNRRAIALHKIAQIITQEYNNILPDNPDILENFPGIGKATAGSIIAFAYNYPSIFIETNIRTVFIYFFFHNQDNIHDKQILPLIEKTLDKNNPRCWYYALMDYGVWLKKTVGNLSRKSAHYAKQSKFEGSDRQIRGQILQSLLENTEISKPVLLAQINKEEPRVTKILENLSNEGYLTIQDNTVKLIGN